MKRKPVKAASRGIAAAVAAAAACALAAPSARAAWNPFAPPEYATAAEQFDYAQMREKEKSYKQAMDAYQRVADAFPSSPLAAEAQFRVGSMLEKTHNYYEAFNAYQAVLDTYPSYPKVNLIIERQYRIGNLFLQGKEIGFLKINPSGSCKRAINIFRKILSNAPFSDLAPKAQYSLGMAHLKRKEYVDAAIEFEKIPLRYPYSDYVAPATFQRGVCAYRQAKAAPYDQEAAQEALNRLRSYIEEFPGDKNAEVAKNMMMELQSRRAEALYKIGRFYEARGNPKAALIYLREVMRDYPLTRYAEKVRKVASREEKKLELVEAARSSGQKIDDLRRQIRGVDRDIKRIKSRGGSRWRVWKYVLPRRLTADEKLKISELVKKRATLSDTLAFAALELEEKKTLLNTRSRFLRAEGGIEKTEDELHEAQVALQVAQNRLSDIGDLPEEEASILEETAAAIAEKEGEVRQIEDRLGQERIALASLEEKTVKEEARLEAHYKRRREQLKARIAKRLSEEASTPGEEKISAAAPRGAAARRWGLKTRLARVFSRRTGRGGDEDVIARCEGIFRGAEQLMAEAEAAASRKEWSEAMRRYDDASLKLMELKKAWPDYRREEVALALARCSAGLGDSRRESDRQQYAELSDELEKRIKKDPLNADPHFSLAVLSQKYGDTDRAVREYKKVIEINPRDAAAHHNLAVTYGNAGKVPEAAASLRKAVELDPENATARHNLGVVLKELGDNQGAREAFEKAIELDPGFAPSYFTLGYLYGTSLGDRRKAVECWEKYCELRPDDPQVPRLKEWIAHLSAGEEGAGKAGGKISFFKWLMFWQGGEGGTEPAVPFETPKEGGGESPQPIIAK